MTISLPGSSGKNLTGLFKRKKPEASVQPTAQKQLDATQVARLFNKKAKVAKPAIPARLSETERSASAQLTNLRGALYGKE